MKIPFLLLFFCRLCVLNAQVLDNFSDRNFTHNPVWNGDSADFIVNSSTQLQLNAVTAGSSVLVTAFSPDFSREAEWRFYIRQNFSPSSSNYGRVYLLSNSANLKGSLEGYYLQFGESLSNDAVELFRQDGSVSVSICRGTDGQIASSFAIGIKVTRSEIGLWTLWVDPAGGSNYDPVAFGSESLYTTGTHMGLLCAYTSGNRSNFYFDDFYAGPGEPDTLLPEISNLQLISNNKLELVFSERMDLSTLTRLGNYSIIPGNTAPDSAFLVSAYTDRVQLHFPAAFSSGQVYDLLVSGAKDYSGNFILPGSSRSFVYYDPVYAQAFDIVFSEILFEPSSSSSLPNAEYVELYNRSGFPLSLSGWTLSDGSSTAVITEGVLLPDSFLLLCSASTATLFAGFGNVKGVSGFPTLNNDVGDRLVVRDHRGKIIDDFTFNDQAYRDPAKDDGGWSLERIDTRFPCPDPLNWRASVHPSGGTPGRINSVHGNFTDRMAPSMWRASLEDSARVRILFSERMDTTALFDSTAFRLLKDGLFIAHPDSAGWKEDCKTMRLRFPVQLSDGIYRLECKAAIFDCPGNRLESNVAVRIAFPELPAAGDVVINEVLFNPLSGGSDFVELYNSSGKTLNMKGWKFAEGAFADPVAPSSSKIFTTEDVLLFPGDYGLISRNIDDIKSRYTYTNTRVFYSMSDLPDFNNTNGAVWLFSADGTVLDNMEYEEKWHHPLLQEVKGVSLERLSPDLPSLHASNWHSAASTVGFASPGLENSLSLSLAGQKGTMVLDPPVFFPDNDGYKDVLKIELYGNGNLRVGKVLVYDLGGSLIRKLEQQALFGDATVLLWDGNADNGSTAAAGMYVVLAELFDSEGQVEVYKKVCALSRK